MSEFKYINFSSISTNASFFFLLSLSRDHSELSESEPTTAGDDDWRKFFDDVENRPSPSTSTPAKSMMRHIIHSPNAQEAHLAHCWVALTPALSSSTDLSARALEILHRMPLSSPRQTMMLMDWISSCIDYGKL